MFGNGYNEKRYKPPEIPKELDELYENEEREIIVLTAEKCTIGTFFRDNRFCTARTNILCSYNTSTEKLCEYRGNISWRLTKAEFDSRKYLKRFKDLSAYRVIVRKRRKLNDDNSNLCCYYLIKVLEKNIRFKPFDKVLEEYRREVRITDDTLGELILNKIYGQFESITYWCDGEEIDLSVSAESDDKVSLDNAIIVAKEFFRNKQKWNDVIRKAAAQKLTGLANDWNGYDENNEEPKKITEEDFARRISPAALEISCSGEFSLWFGDDEMFWGHSVVAYGNVESGVEHVDIVG